MPLSEHEQRMLEQIESALYAEDPKFASHVRSGRMRGASSRRRFQAAALFVLGLALLIVGVAVPGLAPGGFPVLSVVGFIVMFGAAIFAFVRRGPVGPPAGPAPTADGEGRRPRAAGGGFSARMEERFKRRFDET